MAWYPAKIKIPTYVIPAPEFPFRDQGFPGVWEGYV